MDNLSPRPITTAEEIFQFCCDQNEERQREIQCEDLVSRIARGQGLNLN